MFNEKAALDFQWFSPLGASVFLFLLQAVLTLIASVVALALNPSITTPAYRESGGFIFSGRMDSLFFGKSIQQLINDNPELLEIDRYSLYVRASLWLALALFQIALVWFGLREGQAWALWTIVAANFAALVGWVAVLIPFLGRGVSLGLDMPPVVLIVAPIVLPIATILGWVGLRQ